MADISKVPYSRIEIKKYKDIISPVLYNEILTLGEKLKRIKIAVVNSTASGGGVAEILKSLIPMFESIGINIAWYVTRTEPNFFSTTKKLHNLLQGQQGKFSDKELKQYIDTNKQIAEQLKQLNSDVLIINDPQPLSAGAEVCKKFKTVWHCHVDTSFVNEWARAMIVPFVNKYSRVIFSLSEYELEGINKDKLLFFPPAIDPLSLKNVIINRDFAENMLRRFKIDPRRPILVQISRFDHWKDPLGVIKSYLQVRKHFPDSQLILTGSLPEDDPEAIQVIQEIKDKTINDENIFILSDRDGLGSIEINALQTIADVVIQKSKREGFGLTVTEAMWKKNPVVGGKTGGIKVQIEDGISGFLVETIEQCTNAVITLLKDVNLKTRMGEKAKESVREKYLMPRLLRDYMLMLIGMT
ncbi:MAG: glycosyltransferase [Candidatus Levybacteria bacterium]|nr:glycosyltransferase [Candidatus Levybacteria bacterium]